MEKDRKKKIIALLVIVVISTLSIAFAAVSRTININGTAKMDTASWDVHFDNLSKANLINTAEEVNEPNYADNKGTIENINVKLKNPKDEVIYTVDIVNDGTMDAEVTVTSITDFTEEESKLLDFGVYYSDSTKITKYDLLEAGKRKEVTIKLRYKDDITEFDLPEVPLTINFGFTLNYIQSDASMVVTPEGDLENVVSMLAGGNNATSTFFNSNITKETVESITFLNTLKVPKEVQSTAWDASENKDGSVIGWYTDLDENNLYEVNISGNGKIYAPQNSAYLFRGFTKLKTINFNGNFDTSNVKIINHIFYNCSSLEDVDFNYFDTSNVTNMSSMFHSCISLVELDLSSFNTSNVTDMGGMFMDCSKLSKINLSSFDTSNVISMGNMFRGCALTELDISNFNTSKVTTMERMFIYNSKLKNLDLNNFDTSNVTNMNQMFRQCSSLKELKIDNFDTQNVTKMGDMFYQCLSLVELNVSNFNTSKVTNMSYMFYNCSSLTKLDVSKFDTEKVTTMANMLNGCSILKEIDVSKFNTSNVTTMVSMFSGCTSLSKLDLSSFDTSNVTSMRYMFNNCNKLVLLDLSSFDTSIVTDMTYMFNNCSLLTSLNLKNANFSSVTSYSYMFTNCTLLEEIDISGVISDILNNDNYKKIINAMPKNITVYVLNEECVTLGQSINANLNYVVKSA